MTGIAGLRSMAEYREGKTEKRAGRMHATEGGQGKSACHTHRKPLIRRGFCVAGGSVACGSHNIRQGYQVLGMAGLALARRSWPQ